MSEKQYAERDAMALEKAGGWYSLHVSAMTTEGLHSKSDIAAELAWRDVQIMELKGELLDLKIGFRKCEFCGCRSNAKSRACCEKGREADKLSAAPAAQPERWRPEACPITGLPFFMWIEHHETDQLVPTYGGPYDSYTIPVKQQDGSYCRERYDHDSGGWVTDEIDDVGVQIVSDQLYVSEHDPAAAPAAQPEPVAWCHLAPSGKIAYFDGKPMVMPGSVGSEHHETPLYAGIKEQP